MKYIPNFLGTSRGGGGPGGASSGGGGGVVSWSPEGYARDGKLAGGRSTRHSRATVNKTSTAHSDAHYGMSILKTSSYDVETSSQEAIVPKEGEEGSDRTRSESEFGGVQQEETRKDKGGTVERAGSVVR